MRRIGLLLAFLTGLTAPGALAQDDPYNMQVIADNAGELYSDASPAFGNPNADVTIVEFFDYRCGYCKASEAGVEQLLQEDPNIKIIFKDFPKLGQLSSLAAVVTLASMRQGADKYYLFHSTLMNKDFVLTNEDKLYKTAASVGLDVDQLKKDMTDPAITQQIENNITAGENVGVRMTPTFIIGGRLFPGYAEHDKLKQMIDYVRATDQK